MASPGGRQTRKPVQKVSTTRSRKATAAPSGRARQLAEEVVDSRLPADTPPHERRLRKDKLIKGKIE